MQGLNFGGEQTLKEFAHQYACALNNLIDESNHFKCPKIEANYDDYQNDTIRPINSTVFYFFFNADKYKRSLAQVLLTAFRYPNERVRRAYMRYFGSKSFF